jgi:hypothetical protein
MAPVPSPRPTESRRRRRSLASASALGLTLLSLAFTAAAEAAVPRSFFGLSAVRPTQSDFERMGESGAGSFRVEIAWPAVAQKKRGPLVWAGTDSRFLNAATAGLEPVPIIFGTPRFISGDGRHVRGPVKGRAQRQAWEQFVEAAAQRYGPGGDFWTEHPTLDPGLAPVRWIIWNEQNARPFWHPAADPAGYAKLLRATRRGVDRVDPSLKLTVGGMYGFPRNSKSISAKSFLKQLYRQPGAKQLIDGVSVHPYASGINGVERQVKDLRQVMDRAGDRRAYLYIGETGWASGGPRRSFLVKNRAKQAKLLKRSYELFLARRERWRVESVFWFTWRDYPGDPICNWCPKAGLLNERGKLKPSGEAFEALIDKRVG